MNERQLLVRILEEQRKQTEVLKDIRHQLREE